MGNIRLKTFEGAIPRIHPKLLDLSQAQTAENCDLSRGNIVPLLDLEYEADTGGLTVVDSDGDQVVDTGADDVITDQTNTIYQLGDNWLGWEAIVSVVKSFIADNDNRIYYTGNGLPKQTDETLATSGDAITWPTASYRLGIPAPVGALTYSIEGAGGSQVARSTAYVYTYITGWEEESAPSDVTDVFDVETSAEVTEIDCAAASAFTGGEYFLLSTPSIDFYVWFYVNGAGEVTTISNIGNVASLTGGDYFTFSSPTVDYYAWYFLQGLQEISWVTCKAAAALTTGWYFTIVSPAGSYYVWFNKSGGAGGDPSPGGTGLQVVLDGSETDAQVATATAAIIEANANFGATADGTKVIITNAARGVVADTGAGTSGLTVSTNQQGVNDAGTDPAVADHTAIQVTVISGGDAASVTDATGAAIDDYVAFHAVSDGASEVEITNNSRGDVTDADNGTSSPGFTFVVDTQGSDDVGTDPDVASKSGIRVTVANDDTNEEVATTAAAVLESVYAFEAESTTNKVTVTNVTGGAVTDGSSGDIGFPVTVITQGSTNTVVLSAFVHDADSDLNITGFRIYRLSSGTAVAEYTYVTEIELTLTSESGAYSAATTYAKNAVVSYGGYFYISLQNTNLNKTPGTGPAAAWWILYTYTDSTDEADLGEILPTEGWDEPPTDMEGLILFVNSILVGFTGNQVYFSVPGFPYAWPDEYALHFPDDIVGLGRVGEYLVVATEGQPFLITGSDPETMMQIPLPYKQPALAIQGIVSTEIGVIYTCEDGLFLVDHSGGSLATRMLYTKSQWMALGPENIISTFYDGKYYGFFNGTGTGIIINMSEPFRVTTINISNIKILDTYTDGDALYLLCQDVDPTSDDYLEYNVYKWEGSDSYLTLTWKSKQFQSQLPSSFATGRVTADGAVTFNLYGDESLIHTKSVTSDNLFRLPTGRNKTIEIEVTGTKEVDFIAIATSPDEIL